MINLKMKSTNWSRNFHPGFCNLLQARITLQRFYHTQWLFHVWIFFAFFLVIAGSDSGEGSFASSQTSTDEVLRVAEARGPLSCTFPSHWIGNWFQSGVRSQITITSSVINTKGKCLEVDGEKYLVYQPHTNCYKCLVFSEKHVNVLQYKETFCIHERRSISSICSTISGDANLYAMFRLNAQPIDCPFQGPFSFSYDRGYGECRYPKSNLDSCIQKSRLLFNYQACPDVPKTESVEEELQCLAAWKEGSYRYFLGLIQHDRLHASSYEDRFRCFAYEVISGGGDSGANGNGASVGNMRRGEMPLLSSHHNGHRPHHHHGQQYPQTLALGRSRPKPYHGVTSTNFMMNTFNNNNGTDGEVEIMYRVEQSADATCDGLSTMEGARRMFLRKVREQTTENCEFPSWVQTHAQWHSLDNSFIYEFDGDQFRVTNYSSEQLISASGPDADSLAMSGTCFNLLDDEPGHRAKVVLHARSGCKIGYQCLVLYKRDADILEVQFGEWSRKHEEACHFHFDPTTRPYLTLISSTPKTAQCPALGEFSFKLTPSSHWEQTSKMDMTMNRNFLGDRSCTTNGTLRMGCSSLDSLQLEISSHCQDHNQDSDNDDDDPSVQTKRSFREVTDYNCHGWWEEDGITYMVATLSSSPTKLDLKRHCFVLRDSSSEYPAQWRSGVGEGQMSLFQHSNIRAVAGQQQENSLGKSRQMLEDEETSSTSTSAALFFFNNNNNNNLAAAGKILEISTFADSCRRNVIVGRHGERAFNATKLGHCFASSSSPSVIIRVGSVKGWKSMSMVMVMREMMTSVTMMPPRLGMENLSWVLPLFLVMLMRW